MGDVVKVVGQSQYMDSPDREVRCENVVIMHMKADTLQAPVTMMNWVTGNGTAKYWINKLLIDEIQTGDIFMSTNVTGNDYLHAQAFLSKTSFRGVGSPYPYIRKVLLINKNNNNIDITFPGGWTDCVMLVVDSISNEGPPRTVECNHDNAVTLTPYATAIAFQQVA